MAKRPASAIAALTNAQLHAELARRQSKVGALQRRRNALARRLATVEAKIRAAGGEIGNAGPGRRGGRRARNKVTLPDTLRQVLKGKKLGVAEIIDAVLSTGFKTTSKNFRTMVAIQLGKTKGLKRVSRGVYTAK